jgi:threonine dehydratase
MNLNHGGMRNAVEPALAYRPPLAEVGPRPPRAGVEGMSINVADVEAARRTIASQVLRTPMLPAPKLSALTGAEVYVKYENLQVTNSFKDRGAFNKLASLSPTARARGVIAMSAGNHAQAVAYHAARLAIPATIVMPLTTPFVKVEAT